MAKKLFSSDQYKASTGKDTENKIHDIEMPSGFVFRGQKLDFEHCVLTGSLPLSLTRKYEDIQKKNGKIQAEDLNKQLSMAEVEKSIQFTTYVLNHCLVLPEIVEDPATDTQCRLSDISKEDLLFFIEWATTPAEVEEAEGLEMFPGGRQSIVSTSPDKPKHKHKSQ